MSMRALDDLALRLAIERSARQPRCDLTIQQLPAAGTLTGAELVPVFQNGQTYAVSLLTIGVITGTGSPNGVVSALGGTLFLRRDGGVGTRVYVNQGVSALSTSWLPIASV
jgi:hypothetical protein